MSTRFSDDVDVMIMAEGTYPYRRGGVAAWIHQLISGLHDFKFGVIFIGSKPEDYEGIKYDLPSNLVHLETHYLFDMLEKPQIKPLKGNTDFLSLVERLHEWFRFPDDEKMPEKIKTLDFYSKTIDEEQFLYGRESWSFITSRYMEMCPELPFIDYFWTARNIHAPIWRVAKIAGNIGGSIKLLHSPSTGYAGFLGALLHFHTGRPFIITEHGIYTKERKIDLLNADWLVDKRTSFQKELGEIDHITRMWIRFFEGIGRLCYEAADRIISLFDGIRSVQIAYGTAPEKTKVIPNGVDLKKLRYLRNKRPSEVPMVIVLIGRVVSIKDIKTFIKALKMVASRIPEAEGWIVGPEDEDEDYAAECHSLVDSLGLAKNIKFFGYKNIEEVFPRAGVATLTSISEGMPLVILEAFGAGVPFVATDVGACRQLIYGGMDEDDKNMGRAGEVVPIANPSMTADAYIRLLTDKEEWERAQKAAIERVERYYSTETFLESYRNAYEEALSRGRNRV